MTKLAELALVGLYEAGASSTALAKKYDTSPGTVIAVLEEHGVLPRQGSLRPSWTGIQVKKALRLFDEDVKITKIAKQLKLGDSTVRSLLRRNGRRMRPGGRRRNPNGYVNHEGYRVVRVDLTDPMSCMGQGKGSAISTYVLEHRLVLARKLCRPLLSHETVHHKDGDPLNNDPKNLELRVGRHGRGATTHHCKTCTCFT